MPDMRLSAGDRPSGPSVDPLRNRRVRRAPVRHDPTKGVGVNFDALERLRAMGFLDRAAISVHCVDPNSSLTPTGGVIARAGRTEPPYQGCDTHFYQRVGSSMKLHAATFPKSGRVDHSTNDCKIHAYQRPRSTLQRVGSVYFGRPAPPTRADVGRTPVHAYQPPQSTFTGVGVATFGRPLRPGSGIDPLNKKAAREAWVESRKSQLPARSASAARLITTPNYIRAEPGLRQESASVHASVPSWRAAPLQQSRSAPKLADVTPATRPTNMDALPRSSRRNVLRRPASSGAL